MFDASPRASNQASNQASHRASNQASHGAEAAPPAPLVPELVAHRGAVDAWPENTLAAVLAAVHEGARYVEVDVQLTADGVPVLLHDPDLARTAGRPGLVEHLTVAEATSIDVHEPARFGDRHAGITLPTLAALAEVLAGRSGLTVFVEIKPPVVARVGGEEAVRRVRAEFSAGPTWVPIGFDAEVAAAARAAGLSGGWVLRETDDAARRRAEALAPDHLFCRVDRLPAGRLWPGPWRWVVYDVTDDRVARSLAGRGADLVETPCFAELRRRLAAGAAP